MSRYNFRLRFLLPTRQHISSAEKRIALSADGIEPALHLISPHTEKINESIDLVIAGSGFVSADEAKRQGHKARTALMLASAVLRIGVDCGNDVPRGSLASFIKERVKKEEGVTIHDDVHGLFIYKDEAVGFFSAKASLEVGHSADAFLSSFKNVLVSDPSLNERQTTCLELLNLYHFEASARARFLAVITGIEVLCERRRRSAGFRKLLGQVQKFVQSLSVDQANKKALVAALGELKTESISASCKHEIQERLGEQHVRRFVELYALRSGASHRGHAPPDMHKAAADADALALILLMRQVGIDLA
jgi:hypothetical protein